jgi:hypothetical protein
MGSARLQHLAVDVAQVLAAGALMQVVPTSARHLRKTLRIDSRVGIREER